MAYGDASAALNADTVVTTGFVKYTIMNADDTESSSDYVVAGEAPAAVTGANGTGFIYTVGDVDKGYLAYSSAIPAADMTGDVVVYRGYVTVTYVDTNDIGITGEEVVKYNETSLEVTYGVVLASRWVIPRRLRLLVLMLPAIMILSLLLRPIWCVRIL